MPAAINTTKKGRAAGTRNGPSDNESLGGETMPTNTVTPEDVPQDTDLLTLTHDELFEAMCELRPPGVSDEQIESVASRFHGVTVRISAVRAAEADLKAAFARGEDPEGV